MGCGGVWSLGGWWWIEEAEPSGDTGAGRQRAASGVQVSSTAPARRRAVRGSVDEGVGGTETTQGLMNMVDTGGWEKSEGSVVCVPSALSISDEVLCAVRQGPSGMS